MKRPCINCGTPTNKTRCPPCQTKHTPTTNEQQTRRRFVEQYTTTNGTTCPGYQTPPHPTDKLEADHLYSRTNQGQINRYQALCKTCNTRRKTLEGQGTPPQQPHPNHRP